MSKDRTPAVRRVRARRWIALSTVAAAGLAAGASSAAAPAGDDPAKPRAESHRPATHLELAANTGAAEGGEPGRREVRFDLERSLDEVHAAEGKSTLFDRLAKTRTDSLRIWADCQPGAAVAR